MTISRSVDILIIGGGAGGLSSALTLSRQLHTAVVFNHGIHRNAVSDHMHNVLTWDNRDPKDFLKAGKENLLANYDTVQFCDSTLTKVKRTDAGGFEAYVEDGSVWEGRKLIVASGVQDLLPDLPGYKECWFGKSIFHCFFCHGYESRGSDSAGILAIDGLTPAPPVLHFARNAQRFAKRVVIYTHGSNSLADELTETLSSHPGIKVEPRAITRLVKGEHASEVLVRLADGSEHLQAFLGHKPRTRMNGPWAEQLGLEMDAASGDPRAKPPFFSTSVPGVFLCGDLSSPLKIVPNAMLSGAAAGAGACAELQAEMMGQVSMVSVVENGAKEVLK